MRTKLLALATGLLAFAGCTADLPTEGTLASGDPQMIDGGSPTPSPFRCFAGEGTGLRTTGTVNSLFSNAILPTSHTFGSFNCTTELTFRQQHIEQLDVPFIGGSPNATVLDVLATSLGSIGEGTAEVLDLDLEVPAAVGLTPAVHIQADVLQSFANSACSGSSADAVVRNLRVNGTPVSTQNGIVDMEVAGVRIRTHDRTLTGGPGHSTALIHALRITVPSLLGTTPTQEIFVASSRSGILCFN